MQVLQIYQHLHRISSIIIIIIISAFSSAVLTRAKAAKALMLMERMMKALVDLQRQHQPAVQSMKSLLKKEDALHARRLYCGNSLCCNALEFF